MRDMLKDLREASLTVTAVVAAGGAIFGLYQLAGALITATVATAIAAVATVLAVQRALRVAREIQETVADVRYHLAPNGREAMLPEPLRGLPVRELVSHCVVQQQETNGRLSRGDERMGRIEGRLGAIEERRTA